MTSATLHRGRRLRPALAFSALATCAALGLVGPTHAASGDAPAVTLRYSALSLSTEQGALALYGRIVAAAHEVCAADNMLDLNAMATARVCRERVVAKAVRDIHSPLLASVHTARGGASRND
jgi:UrcA family protein